MPTAGEVQNPPAQPESPAVTTRAHAAMQELADAKAALQTPPMSVDSNIIADKELRRDLDAQLRKLKWLPASRERSLCITKIQEAIMWLGMDLKRLNDTRPYPSSYDPSNTKVEPTADGLRL